MEILVQLNILTGAQFTSPTGVIGSYNHSKCIDPIGREVVEGDVGGGSWEMLSLYGFATNEKKQVYITHY